MTVHGISRHFQSMLLADLLRDPAAAAAARLPSPPSHLGAVGLFAARPAIANAAVDGETAFVLNTFAFLVWGALVMWMCAGFTMLEAGSVRTKNAAMICLKNIGLYSIAGLAYFIIGYNLMYGDLLGGVYRRVQAAVRSPRRTRLRWSAPWTARQPPRPQW